MMVTIGSQTWMAENLNYDPGDVTSMGSYAWHGCFDNQSINCSRYGRLYTWEVAMNDANCAFDKSCSPSGTIRGVCPSGWHLPNNDEWNSLFAAVGGIVTAGAKLKSTSGWNYNGYGSDTYGFSALPAGYRLSNGYFDFDGDFANFWSSTEYDSINAYVMYLYFNSLNASLRDYDKDFAFFIRCVKD